MGAPDQEAIGADTVGEPVGPLSFMGAKRVFVILAAVAGAFQGH